MKPILWLYIINTVVFTLVLAKQFLIIVKSPENDEHFTQKVLFFVFNIMIMITMWLCYFRIRESAWFFFGIAIFIAVWTYYHKPKQKT